MTAGKKKWLWLGLAVVAIALVITAVCLLSSPKSPKGNAPVASQALSEAGKGLDDVTVEAELSKDGKLLTVRQRMTLTNREGLALDKLVLRAYANAFASAETSPAASDELFDLCYPKGFSQGGITLEKVLLGGREAQYSFTDTQKTVLALIPQGGWPSGKALNVELAYQLTIPDAAYRFGQSGGVITLGNALILPAVYQNGAWREEPYYPVGDPFISRCMNFNVTLTVPAGYTVAASAYAEPEALKDGNQKFHFTANAMRDFALSLSRSYRTAKIVSQGTQVLGVAQNARHAGELARLGDKALSLYSELYGEYPYPSLTIAQVDFPFGGMEYPGYIMLETEMCRTGGQELEIAVAHEVAHQWWYAVVGSDSYYDPWQDEGLAEYSVLDYWERYYGEQARDELARVRHGTAMQIQLTKQLTPGSPIDYYDDSYEYATMAYRRGASLFEALRLMNKDGLRLFLTDYYAQYRFQIATRSDFEQLLSKDMGMDVKPILTDYLDTQLSN